LAKFYEGREDEADPVDREEALDLGRLRVDLDLGALVRLRRNDRLRLLRPGLLDLLHRHRRCVGDLVGDADVEEREDGGEQDHEHAEAGEDERRVGNFVSH
jgi:hypothetical protein